MSELAVPGTAGSATSTIGMTVPTALVIAYLTKQNIELGLEYLQVGRSLPQAAAQSNARDQ
eukprot:SAG22_NODE_8057_length_687_cov_0.731293_1_plen_61_part_00